MVSLGAKHFRLCFALDTHALDLDLKTVDLALV